MFLLSLKRIAVALMAMGIVATGAGVLARQGPGDLGAARRASWRRSPCRPMSSSPRT